MNTLSWLFRDMDESLRVRKPRRIRGQIYQPLKNDPIEVKEEIRDFLILNPHGLTVPQLTQKTNYSSGTLRTQLKDLIGRKEIVVTKRGNKAMLFRLRNQEEELTVNRTNLLLVEINDKKVPIKFCMYGNLLSLSCDRSKKALSGDHKKE